MHSLQALAHNLWVVSAPSKFYLFHVGTRMTVVRLSNGALLLHSPIVISDPLKKEINALGQVTHIICPNNFHHMYAQQAMSQHPQAQLHGPAALHKKRKDLRFNSELSDSPHPDWAQDLTPITIKGSLMHETVFYHGASKTLITSDIVENFESAQHWPTRLWLKAGDCHGKVNWPRLLRLVYFNRKAARTSFKQVFELPFDKVVLAHGNIIEQNTQQTLKSGLSWLGKF